jgi:pimeloyl-ACP methyl ester carboxylesterase
MPNAFIKDLRSSAARMEGCDPLWIRNPDSVVFNAKEEGTTGPEVVLLHGLLGAVSNCDSLVPKMAQYSRPIALSLPILTGHRSEVKVKALALYAEYFLRQRKLAPAALCGNSLGGHVAMRLCLANPQLVDCLILSGTSGLYEHSVDSLPVRPDRKFIREHMSRVFYNQQFVTEEGIDDIKQILSRRMNMLNIIHAARSAKKDNLLDLLKNIEVPTLLLWGEDDTITTMDVAEQFHKHIKNSQLVTIKKCGHAPMIEYPEWFAEQVKVFLEKNSRYYKQHPVTP